MNPLALQQVFPMPFSSSEGEERVHRQARKAKNSGDIGAIKLEREVCYAYLQACSPYEYSNARRARHHTVTKTAVQHQGRYDPAFLSFAFSISLDCDLSSSSIHRQPRGIVPGYLSIVSVPTNIPTHARTRQLALLFWCPTPDSESRWTLSRPMPYCLD